VTLLSGNDISPFPISSINESVDFIDTVKAEYRTPLEQRVGSPTGRKHRISNAVHLVGLAHFSLICLHDCETADKGWADHVSHLFSVPARVCLRLRSGKSSADSKLVLIHKFVGISSKV
jgi:hypothetical protein